uniref:Cyclin-dependent protein kinase inhibitor SMR1-like n=1 Tax=Nelumbo nucifera TaxID=4432 RepID=A0A822Y806_NELNU|nr:TPA_asm: hypothetical protein HUJ06_030098 [Nelumbo nucifera]
MSTDLQLRCSLPEIRVRPAAEIQSERSRQDGGAAENQQLDYECSTPTSEESKIPIIQSCPPAPRKPRKVVLCKRKFSEKKLQFFRFVSHDEVESFFKSSFQTPLPISRHVKKRRCASE